jgi:hypothetical protein
VRQLSEFASDLVSVLIHIASVEVLPAVVLNEIVAAGEIQIQLCFLRYGNFMKLCFAGTGILLIVKMLQDLWLFKSHQTND